MNAADQRRLTPWLGVVCVLLVVLWLAFAFGLGRGIHWLPPGTARPLPQARHAARTLAAPPLQRAAEVWQRPLFTSDRKPAPVAASAGGSAVTLNDLALTGVILAPGMHIALLTDRGDGHTVRVREGEHLAHGSWLLKTLKPRSAEFVNNGQVTRLPLKVPEGKGGVSEVSAPAPVATSSRMRVRPAQAHPTPAPARQHADKQRIQALKARIEQRRRQQAAHAGEH